MDRHDREFLEKQLRAINGDPPRGEVIIVEARPTFSPPPSRAAPDGNNHGTARTRIPEGSEQ